VTTSATHTFFNGPTFLLPDVSGAEARWRLSADGCASVVGEDADVHTIVVDSPFDLVSVEGWAVYERPAPLPRVHLATKVHSLDSDSVLEALASDAGTDVVYVSGAEGRERYGGGTAELMRDESDEASVRVHSVGEGLLVFRDVAASGWIATVDGTPTEMLRADHAFRAAPVPSGWSTVDFEYKPFGRTALLPIAGIALATLGSAFAAWWSRRRGRQHNRRVHSAGI